MKLQLDKEQLLHKICNTKTYKLATEWNVIEHYSVNNTYAKESILYVEPLLSLKDLNYLLNIKCLEYEIDAKFYVYSTRINPLVPVPWDHHKFIDNPQHMKLVHIKVIFYNYK